MDERTVITIGREFGSGGHEIGMQDSMEAADMRLARNWQKNLE